MFSIILGERRCGGAATAALTSPDETPFNKPFDFSILSKALKAVKNRSRELAFSNPN
jgi:hypothetical protein